MTLPLSETRWSALYAGASRLGALLMAGTLSLLLTVYPQAVMHAGQAPSHWLLVLALWGMAAGFVYGVGFVPRTRWLRLALGAAAAWLLMPGSIVLLMWI